MIKDKKKAFVIYVVLFVVFWNIAEMIWRIVTGGSSYTNTTDLDITFPLILAFVTGYLLYIANGVDINDELKEARKTPGAVIVDVRNASEYAEGHIPGAISIPGDSIEKAQTIISDKSTPVYTYCLRGSRSSRAAKDLKMMGYETVINMGGINRYKGDLES